jgi:SAM-dependent methyltransferase
MSRTLGISTGLLALLLLPAAISAAEEKAADQSKPKQIRTADCVYVPTPNDVVEKMLEMGAVKKADLLYDLGCGDGRIVVMAAKKFGCKAVGYEIDPDRVAEGRASIKKKKIEHLAKIEQEDIFKLDVSKANVIMIYLLPGMITKLLPQLEKLQPGSRIVAHDYAIAGAVPDKEVEITSNEDNVKHTLYLYTLPLKKEKK